VRAVVVEKGPPIDGTLASPLWQKCPPLPLGQCTSPRPGPFETTARVLFSPTHLYVAFECAEPDTAGLKQDVTQRDGAVWEDDCVELFITGDVRRGYFHFVINPRGTLMDARKKGAGSGDTSWNSTAVVRTSIVPGQRWILTMAVPLKELGAYVGENQTWVMNLNRTRPARGGRALVEWSWAVMGSNDYHQVRDYGRITGVRIPRRDGGVTRRAAAPPLVPTYEKGEEAGGVAVYRRFEQMTIPDDGNGTNKQIDLLIRGSEGLKVAFLARGTGGVKTAQFNLYDERAKDNTTSDAYRIVDEQWRPILYRCDRFFYNDGMNRRVARATSYRNLRFHGNKTPDGKGRLELRNFVIYRGEDATPPSAPGTVSASAEGPVVRLACKPATDNVGVASYVIARTTGNGKFVKIAELCTPELLDMPGAGGIYRYRVLAVDFQDNMGPWSEPVRVELPAVIERTALPPKMLGSEVQDRSGYANHVRAIHAAGAGKVTKGRVLCFGDSITGATNYRRYVESALGRYDVWARGYAAMRTDFGRNRINAELRDVNPEFCLIMYGTNNSKAPQAIPPAMDDLLAVARSCATHGTVPIIATIPPRGFADPKSEPEARFNRAVIQMCRANRIPIAYVFEAFLAFEKKGDRRTLLAGDGVHYITGGWEVTARAWKAAMDQVNFVLLDRPR